MQQDGFDGGSLFGIQLQALFYQISKSVVSDLVQSFHGGGIVGIDNAGALRQQIENGRFGLSGKIVLAGGQFVKQHAQTPGIVILLDLKGESLATLFRHGEFGRTGLGTVIFRAGLGGYGRFQIDALDLLSHQDKVFGFQVGPDQPTGMHGLDAAGNGDGRPAELGAVQAALFATQIISQVFVSGFQQECGISLGNALGAGTGVDVGQKGHLFDITRSGSLERKQHTTLAKDAIVVLVLSRKTFDRIGEFDGQFGSGGVVVGVGLVGIIDLGSLGGTLDEISHQQINILVGASTADDLAVQVVIFGRRWSFFGNGCWLWFWCWLGCSNLFGHWFGCGFRGWLFGKWRWFGCRLSLLFGSCCGWFAGCLGLVHLIGSEAATPPKYIERGPLFGL